MTTIRFTSHASPLRAAREWRERSLMSVASACGLRHSQAEALEEGDLSAFESADEMVAAALLYAAELQVGAAEASALMERAAQAAMRPVAAAVIQQSSSQRFDIALEPDDMPFEGAPGMRRSTLHVEQAEIVDLDAELAAGPTPEQAVLAADDLHVGPARHLPLEPMQDLELQPLMTDEAIDTGSDVWEDDSYLLQPQMRASPNLGLQRILRQTLGPRRGPVVHTRLQDAHQAISALLDAVRDRLRHSEHLMLATSLGLGVVLLALTVLGITALRPSGEEAGPARSMIERASAQTRAADAADATQAPAVTPPVVKALVSPARITVDVFNAGRVKGQANVTARKVAELGYRAGSVGNAPGSYTADILMYPPALRREAHALAVRLSVAATSVRTDGKRSITVVVT